MKNLNLLFGMFLTGIVLTLCPPAVMAAEGGLSAVLVIDISGSMTSSDPDGTAREAACLFLDMMDRAGSQAAVILFSDKIVKKTSLKELGGTKNALRLKQKLKNTLPQGDTDIGKALEKAVSLLEKAKTPGRKSIILFTDGKTDLPKKTDPEKAMRISARKLTKAARKAREQNIRIDCVRLYREESKDEGSFTELKEAAANSGGTFSACSGNEMIPDIFTRVFAGLIDTGVRSVADRKVGKKGRTSFDVMVPSGGVLSAQIVLLTTTPLTRISIKDPEGKKRKISGGKISVTREEAYSLIRLDEPESGRWHFVTNAEPGCQIHVSLVLENEITLSALVVEDEAGGAVLRAWLGRGEEILGDDLARKFSVKASVRDVSGKSQISEGNYPMVYENGEFILSIPVDPSGEISAVVTARNGEVKKTSAKVAFTSTRSDDIIVNEFPKEIFLRSFLPGKARTKIFPDDYFRSWDGSPLVYTIVTDPGAEGNAFLVSDNKPDEIVLTNKKAGEGLVTVSASDDRGHEESIQVEMTSEIVIFTLIRPFLAVLAVLGASFFLIVIRLKKKPLQGRISLFVTLSEDSDQAALGADLAGHGQKTTFGSLFPAACAAMPDLARVVIQPFRDGIRMSGPSGVTLYDCFGDPGKTLKLQGGDTFEIICSVGRMKGRQVQLSGVYDSRTERNG